MQDHALGVRQHHRGFGVGQLLVERGHLVACAVHQVRQALAAGIELVVRQHRRLARPVGVQMVLLHAALPGLDDHVARLGAEALQHHLHDPVRVAVVLDHREAHGGIPWGLEWERTNVELWP